MAASAERARQAAAANSAWYHTIDLGGGIATPGYVDWRGFSNRLLRVELAGRRALDVGTFDGFWAFEMERRGAAVVAIDVAEVSDASWPPVHRARLIAEQREHGTELGRGFRLARECLGSSVERVVCDVLELTPERIGGPVDVAFLGALLLHLRDPVRALENIRLSLRPGGTLILLETISLRESLLHPRTPVARFDTRRHVFNWWLPNVRTLHDYLWAAGFTRVGRIAALLHPPARREMDSWYAAFRAQAG
jgi:SAM-dependent methyltransferase